MNIPAPILDESNPNDSVLQQKINTIIYLLCIVVSRIYDMLRLDGCSKLSVRKVVFIMGIWQTISFLDTNMLGGLSIILLPQRNVIEVCVMCHRIEFD